MKFYLTILSLIISSMTFGQKNATVINNDIQNVKTLKIYGNGKTVIGKIIMNQTLKTKVLLLKTDQFKDTLTGLFTTIVELGNKDNIPLFGVNITLKFDKPYLSIDAHCTAMSVSESRSNDQKEFIFEAGQINLNNFGPMLQFEIKSKEKIVYTISGIDGGTKKLLLN